MREAAIQPLELAHRIRSILEEKKGFDIALLDVKGLTNLTDYFLLASGTSAPHLKAMREEVLFQLKKEGVPCHRHSGMPESGWLAMDYFDVFIHLFLEDTRQYYDLEKLWAKARRIE